MVTKSYLPSYLCDSSDGSDSNESSLSSGSSDTCESSDKKTLVTKTIFHAKKTVLSKKTYQKTFFKKKIGFTNHCLSIKKYHKQKKSTNTFFQKKKLFSQKSFLRPKIFFKKKVFFYQKTILQKKNTFSEKNIFH